MSRAPGLVVLGDPLADRCPAAPPAAMNPVVLALVAALRDIERSRTARPDGGCDPEPTYRMNDKGHSS